MNREHRPSIPKALRERLEREPADERAELERVWHLLGDADATRDEIPPAEATWAAIQERLGASDAHPRRADRRPRRPRRGRRVRSAWRTWGAVAACVLVVVLAGALLWRQPVEVAAPPGERARVTLPDGSSVELNSGTVLSYRRGFAAWPLVPAERRAVRLHGEAFFEVEPGARPFVVETFNARVEALGTAFNVRARADTAAAETHVTLASGRVRVRAARAPERAVVLAEAGQTSRVAAPDAPPTPPQVVAVDRALAWRHQGFAVSDWPLAAIFAELERRYDTAIAVRAPAVVGDSMTLYYPRHTPLETIIHDIAVAKGLRYRATSRGYEITPQ